MTTTIEQRREAIDETVRRAGGIVAFRKAMGLTHQAVYYWKRIGHVPVDKALQMEKLFGTSRLELVEPNVVEFCQPLNNTDLL